MYTNNLYIHMNINTAAEELLFAFWKSLDVNSEPIVE